MELKNGKIKWSCCGKRNQVKFSTKKKKIRGAKECVRVITREVPLKENI